MKDIPAGTEVYLERGCPHFVLWRLIEKNCEIWQVDGKRVKAYREEHQLEKEDITDAKIIYRLHKNKGIFKKLEKPTRHELRFQMLLGKFRRLMKMTTALKNQRQAYQLEFGNSRFLETPLKILEKRKKQIIRRASKYVWKEVRELKKIRGLNKRLIVKLLAEAHPKEFPTLSKYLIYCGKKGISRETHKYNHLASGYLYQMATSLIRQKNERYYSFYKKVKKEFREEHPDYSDGKIDGMARNRVATFLLKEIYYTVREEEPPENVNLLTRVE